MFPLVAGNPATEFRGLGPTRDSHGTGTVAAAPKWRERIAAASAWRQARLWHRRLLFALPTIALALLVQGCSVLSVGYCEEYKIGHGHVARTMQSKPAEVECSAGYTYFGPQIVCVKENVHYVFNEEDHQWIQNANWTLRLQSSRRLHGHHGAHGGGGGSGASAISSGASLENQDLACKTSDDTDEESSESEAEQETSTTATIATESNVGNVTDEIDKFQVGPLAIGGGSFDSDQMMRADAWGQKPVNPAGRAVPEPEGIYSEMEKERSPQSGGSVTSISDSIPGSGSATDLDTHSALGGTESGALPRTTPEQREGNSYLGAGVLLGAIPAVALSVMAIRGCRRKTMGRGLPQTSDVEERRAFSSESQGGRAGDMGPMARYDPESRVSHYFL